jgi:DNA polymerase III epsilon subunit family exonuclease
MIFFDTETTGLIANLALPLHLQPHIIEIGAVRDDGAEFSQLINPGIKLDKVITDITGLTDADLFDQPMFDEVYKDLIDFFHGHELVAHNFPFDKGMLDIEMRRLGDEFPWPEVMIDTVHLARPLYKGKFKKLRHLFDDLINVPYEQSHRALDDAKMLQRVYKVLVAKLEK